MSKPPPPDDTERLLAMAVEGDTEAALRLCASYRDQLKRIVGLRLDHRVRADASTIVQQAMAEAAGRIKEYAADPPASFILWLRRIIGERLSELHRHHLSGMTTDQTQDLSLYRQPIPEANSISLAQQLLGQMAAPTQEVRRAQLQLNLQEVLNHMDPLDREVLVLRNFEQLSTAEAAEVLGIDRAAASKRYLFALKRLNQAMNSVPGMRPDQT